MKIIKSRFNAFVLISGSVSFFISFFYLKNTVKGYGLTTLFPLVFVFLYFVTFSQYNIYDLWNRATIYMFLILQWIRFVLTPPFIAMAGENNGTPWINPEQDALILATIIMIIDLGVTFVFLFFMSKLNKKNTFQVRTLLRGNKIMYIAFIAIALFLFFIYGRNSDLLNFFVVAVSDGERIGDITDTSLVIIRQIILIAILLIFVWGVSICSKRYKSSGNKIYVFIAILLAIINVGVIVGERRSTQIYNAFCSIWILYNAFPQYKKTIIYLVGGTATVILTFMSIYKFSNAFAYGSYADAIKNSNYDVAFISQILQSYFSGPQGIASIIEVTDDLKLSIYNLLYDLLRSTVPLSFFIKGNLVTSQIYNSYLYGGMQITGQVISALSYGYIYFGMAAFSVFSLLNLYLACYFEDRLNKSKSYEMMYVWAYVFMRVALNLTANTPALLSSTSIMLVTGGLFFKLAQTFVIKKRSVYIDLPKSFK